MKLLILLGVLTLNSAWAKPVVLLTYFDAFHQYPFNNSERIAKTIETRLNSPNSTVEVKVCALKTIFDKAYTQAEDCLNTLAEKPVMMISLGESTCQLKIETMGRNNDKTNRNGDNAGVRRNNRRIISQAPNAIGFRYPLPQMYCALSRTERLTVDLSNNAGSFVCNNTAFQMSYNHPEIQYGFIHVPSNFCDNLQKKSESAVIMLEKMNETGAKFLLDKNFDAGLPHTDNDERLPTTAAELKELKKNIPFNSCLHEYLRKSDPFDGFR